VEDWIGEDNPDRLIDVFVDEPDLAELGFGGIDPEVTGRPSYHLSLLLNLRLSEPGAVKPSARTRGHQGLGELIAAVSV